MKAALIGVVGAFAISLQSATFYYVVNVESRLTRLEVTVDWLRARVEQLTPRRVDADARKS